MPSKENDSQNTEKYIQPLPIWRSDEWLGLGFGQIETKQGIFWQISLVFKEADYAKQVLGAILAWNDGQAVDRDNNIGLSLITEPIGDYTAYLYPTLQGVTLAEPIQTAMLAKPFPNPPGSHFRRFLSAYKGTIFQLTALAVAGDSVRQIPGIIPIWKSGLKTAMRSSLTEKDREYHHGKQVIGVL